MILLTVNDIAVRLQVATKTVYAWATQGKIPSVRINGVLRFDPKHIEPWLQGCQVLVGPPRVTKAATPKKPSPNNDGLDSLVEAAKRAVYTTFGETRPIASPNGKENVDGAR